MLEHVTVTRKILKCLDDAVLEYKEKTGITCNRIYNDALREFLEKKLGKEIK